MLGSAEISFKKFQSNKELCKIPHAYIWSTKMSVDLKAKKRKGQPAVFH